MHLPLLGLLGLGLLRPSVAAAPKTTTTTTVTFQISPSHMLPNPHLLPPSTHATLSAQHAALSAPLTASNALVFRNVSAGSYLVDIHCATHAFAPVRLDVLAVPHERLKQKQRKEEDADADALELQAWETFRGNDWDNVGEALPRLDGGDVFEVRLLGSKAYFAERGGFSVFGILRNPMILIGLVSMGVFIGMPYLVNNSKFSLPPFPFLWLPVT